MADDICSHGRPNHQDLIAELREALGLAGPPLPITPQQAWEEAIAEAAALRVALATPPQPGARAEAQRDAWKEKCHKAWDDVDKQANRAISAELENQRLRAALATQPQPDKFRGIVTDLACTNSGHRTAVETLIERAREALAPEAVAGSATPTGENDEALGLLGEVVDWLAAVEDLTGPHLPVGLARRIAAVLTPEQPEHLDEENT